MSDRIELESALQSLSEEWEHVTEIPQNPRTILQVIEYTLDSRRKAEEYVNRLLRYYLDPENSHGMGAEFLQAFLEALPEDTGFDQPIHDLSGVVVDDQVRVYGWNDDGLRDFDKGEACVNELQPSNEEDESVGIVDLVVEMPDDWFLLIELKFFAGENNLTGAGPSQTEWYYGSSTVGDREKSTYESGGYYLFVRPESEPEAKEPEFENWSWREFDKDVLEPFIREKGPRIPARTVEQLREFRDDIQNITGMSDYQADERRKVELFLEHYEAINDVTSTFDDRWETFTREWPARVVTVMTENDDIDGYADALPSDIADSIDEDEIDSVAAFDIQYGPATGDRWILRGTSSDWGVIFKEGWWRHTDDFRCTYARPGDRNDVRNGFVHRLGRNRDRVLRDGELIFYLRNMGANDQEFIDEFDSILNANSGKIEALLPPATELTDKKRNVLEATYDIHVDEHETIFEAYIEALSRAIVDHVVQNSSLVEAIDSIRREAIESVYDVRVE